MKYSKNYLHFILAVLLTSNAVATAATCPAPTLDVTMQNILYAHFKQYQSKEYFSGGSLSIYIPDEGVHHYFAGTISHEDNSPVVTEKTLFQIGSITKSFTAAIMLQLEQEKLFSLNDKMIKYLPQYSAWSSATIKELLNMTSCLPNYSDTPSFNYMAATNPGNTWSNKDLVAFVYLDRTPPLKTGYMYSNTGYALSDMMVEKLTKHTFKAELIKRTIKRAELSDTFYPVPEFDKDVEARMAHGYNYNQYDNPLIVGKDINAISLSWAAAAGGIVATTDDVIKWVKALFIEDKILSPQQKQKMMQMVSVKTGQPLSQTSAEERQAFGLGIANMYNSEHPRENMWFYEGQTLGFRTMYAYTPCNNVIVAAAFNSSTNGENDQAHVVLMKAYEAIISAHPKLRC